MQEAKKTLNHQQRYQPTNPEFRKTRPPPPNTDFARWQGAYSEPDHDMLDAELLKEA